MLLIDYHLVFIIICFLLLIFSIYLIFLEDKKEAVIAAALICGINWVLCLINYMSFFGVGIIGYSYDGTTSVTLHSDMYGFYVFFYVLQWFNFLLIMFCWFKWTRYTTETKN